MPGEIASGRTVGLDGARRRMVRRDQIEEQAEDAGVLDIGQWRGFHGHAGEIGRLLHIGRVGIPLVGQPALDGDRLPFRIALEATSP